MHTYRFPDNPIITPHMDSRMGANINGPSLIRVPGWLQWQTTAPVMLLQPETPWEGADLPLAPSERGLILERARQLRDPAIFEEDDRVYLLYAVAGEHGIAIAEIKEPT
jgi:hypothetical protein